MIVDVHSHLLPPTVRFTTAVYGVHRPGVVYRMDEIPIPLRAVLPSDGDYVAAPADLGG